MSSDNTNFALNNALKLFNDNNVNSALEQLTEILKVYPDNKEALELIISINVKINDPINALKYINQAIHYFDNNKTYLEKKYKILTYIGDHNNALDCLETLQENYPSIDYVREISNIYADQSNFEQSEKVIQDFFESNKTYSELYKGIRHVKAGRYKHAEESYKNVLKKNKNNVDALRLLGLLAFKQNNFQIAESLFSRALKLNPTFKLLWENLAKCYRAQNKFFQAKKAFQNLLKLDPNNLEAMGALGTIHIRLSDFEEGIRIYENLLSFNDKNPRVHLSLGHAQKTIGRRLESETSYLNAIKNFPLCGEAYWSLANLKTYKFSEKQIQAMESALKADMHDLEKTQMLFALGKAHESLENYDKSFKYYEEGNWMHRKTLDYNAEENSILINKTIDFFEKNSNKLNYDVGNKTKDPIFILGLPRAGSTLIEQILSSHSLIEGTQEHHNIMTIGRKIRSFNNSDNYTDNLFELSNEDINNYGKKYIDETLWSRKESNFFIDKMPNNFPYIGLIKMILPNAKIIDARRNPLDGCFSCFKQFFAKGQHFTYDLDDIARYYKDYQKIMLFWNELYPGSIYTVNYENVINNPEHEVKLIFDYLNLEFEEACMSFYKSKRPVKTASSEQVRQPIYKSGIDYWKNFDNHLSILKEHFIK